LIEPVYGRAYTMEKEELTRIERSE